MPLLVLCAVQLVLQLDLSIVNLGLRSIQGGLEFSSAGLQWVATGYALTFGSLLMLGGRLGDLFGRRRTLIWGLLAFGAASLACGLAMTPGQLVAGRLLQGAGAAAIAPTVLAFIGALYPEGPGRTRALGFWSAAVAVGGTAGVIVGGLLAETLGWRSIFLVNLPPVAILAVLAHRCLPELERQRPRSLDPVGAGSLTLAIGALILGLTTAEQSGFGDPRAWGPLALAGVLAAVFAVNERRASEPMVPLSFLNVRIRRISALTMLLIGGLLAGYMYFIALSLQVVLGFSPALAGLALAPTGVVMFASSMLLSHRLIDRVGLKPVLLVGIAAHGVAMLSLARIGGGTPYLTEVLPPLLLNAAAIGLVFPAVSIGITSQATPAQLGLAGGLVPTAQQVGAALVLAILATLAAAVANAHGGDPGAGYQAGFLGAAGIAAIAAGAVAATSFRSGPEVP